MIQQATFSFDAEMIRSANAASEDSARLIWLMLAFIRVRQVKFDHYREIFDRSERTFTRDMKKLRELGARYGFELAPQRAKVVRLKHFSAGIPPAPARGNSDVLRALSDAFGEIVTSSIQGIVDVDGTNLDPFLRIATPRLTQQSVVAKTYGELRKAWRANARIRFRYPVRGATTTVERIVEPHATTYHAGRYYLIAFDPRPRRGGWRQFALDRMQGPFARAGTFARRVIPEAYRGEDAVGLFKTGPKITVTVELSAAIADAALARRWQRAERIERRADGVARIELEVYDVGEAVRWAFSFGTEARVTAPPAAVGMARRLAAEMLRQHERLEPFPETERERSDRAVS